MLPFSISSAVGQCDARRTVRVLQRTAACYHTLAATRLLAFACYSVSLIVLQNRQCTKPVSAFECAAPCAWKVQSILEHRVNEQLGVQACTLLAVCCHMGGE